jgi:HEAT repeat protein
MSINPDSAKALLSSENFGDRIQGINQLRQFDAETAYKLIQPVIVDQNVRVRYAAVSMLSSIGQVNPSKSLEILRAGLRDPESDVQAAAADAIAGLKLTEGFTDLEQLYRSSQEWIVRFSIISALGELGDSRALEMLAEASQSGDVLLVPAAIGAMGELGDPQAVPLILPFVTDPDWQVRMRVAQALGRFDTPESNAALAVLADDPTPVVAQQAKSDHLV